MWPKEFLAQGRNEMCAKESGKGSGDTGWSYENSSTKTVMESYYTTNKNLNTPSEKYNIYMNPEPKYEINKTTQPFYENMKINSFPSQNRLLRKLFRNATNPDSIYENLCRGCGYGVFEAESNLCNFCSCVVKGLKNNQLQHSEKSNQIYANNGENIYENICFQCSALYNSEECQCCAVTENIATFDKSEETELENTLLVKDTDTKTPNKIKKSKSFHKFDRHNLINGLFGSLKRGVLTRKNVSSRHEDENKKPKQLDIVHHVDGYDNIFRTNETFDLQRICELKQAEKLKFKVSTSDQHIYGRLKLNDTIERKTIKDETSPIYLSKSYEQLQVSTLDHLSTSITSLGSTIPAAHQSLTCSKKRPHISKPCLLSSRSKFTPDYLYNQQNNATLALPLSNSVCYWMKLLRKQVYNYHSYNASFDDEQYALCIPKSIPSKSILINTYYGCSSKLINLSSKAYPTNLEETMTNIPVADKKGDFEIPMHTNCINSQAISRNKITYENMEKRLAVMVDLFKQNIMTKHMLHQQGEREPSVEHSDSLNSIPLADHLIRSEHKRTKHKTIHVNNENNTTFDFAPEHNPISVINSKQPLSTLAMEKRSTSCCSACYVNEVKSDRGGYLSVGDCIPRAPESEFQHQTVTLVKKSQNEKTKQIETETKVVIKTETVDAYDRSGGPSNIIPEEDIHTNIKQINNLPNVTNNIANTILKIKVRNDDRTNQQVAAFAQFIQIPNVKVSLPCNLVCLINNLLISCSLNKTILIKCSNRSQYYDWFQDWLLCHYNPWSFKAKHALKVLANHNRFDITCKLWALLHDSVKRHYNRICKYGKQGERVYIGEILNAQIFTKYLRVTLQCEQQNQVGFNERKSEKINVRKSIEINCQMKTNDEVILRPKSKDTLERSTKAQGKFLDHGENVDELDVNGSKLTTDKSGESLEIELDSTNKISETVLTSVASPLREIGSIDILDNCHNHKALCIQEKEEDIYQPIWEFKTVGNVKESYDSEPECYEASYQSSRKKCLMEQKLLVSDNSSVPSHIIADNVEDHGEWETDDEFMFTKKFHGYSSPGNTISSYKSSSTITSFENSSTDLGTSTGSNLQHPLLRTVCIYFSLNESKIRAIVYDYDRGNASQYFRKNSYSQSLNNTTESVFNSPLASMGSPSTRKKDLASSTTTLIMSESGKVLSAFNLKPVHAWKLNLLNPSYAEDEEDLIVSESEILRSQLFKEDSENNVSQTKTATLQRFKSASFDNLLDIPREDDKKSITERMRNKLQRGVFKLNMRSPKSEKKGNGIFRSVKTGSLYLEEGMRPKFPIFGAPLDQLEMNESLHQQVPRFVVDCVSYIERKECILQDGLYRASGNKLAIDELKKKLSESYIYDSKLLVADDIHTVTSLLKQFFRELDTPLIPQEIYDRISRGTLDSAGVALLRDVLEEISDPNRSTLKFLIRHLKNVAAFSTDNRMPASNLAIVWGPCIFSANQLPFVDIGRVNTLTKLLIENYDYIFRENERLVN